MEKKSNKIGRPRRDNLTEIIKFTVDTETAKAIRSLAIEKSVSQSDLMRELTPILSSKNYETLVPILGIEHLQKISEKCWSDLHTQSAIFPVEEISNFMPAFVTIWNSPQVHVKYPTYKIDVYNTKNNTSEPFLGTLNKLVKKLGGHSNFYYAHTDKTIIGVKDNKKVNFDFICEIMCLSDNLDINLETKANIEKLLDENGYGYSVCPAYCLRPANIELVEDGKYFRVK